MSELEIADAIIRHSLELQRLSAYEEAEALEILRELETELRQLLVSRDITDAGKREIAALIKSADEAIDARYAMIPERIDVHGIALHVAERTADALRLAFPDANLPTAERLASLSDDILIDGAPSSAWWQRQADDTAFRFAAAVRQGVINGETTEKIVSRVIGNDEDPGILETSRRNARALVHSSIMTAANRARLETFRKNSKHAAGVRWLATLDGRTCTQCVGLDGAEWDFDGMPLGKTEVDFTAPPAHFGCRCVFTPVAKGLDDLLGIKGLDAKLDPQVRASANGPTSATTMEEFLRRQPADVVEDMLGEGRAALWRNGTITLRDLVSQSGRPLTLAELKSR